MKPAFALFALLVAVCLCEARPVAVWTYADLTEKADLVVIATPTGSQDTREKAAIPDMPKVAVVGVETKFEVLSVFKGDKELKKFVLYHLRQADATPILNGPLLVSFDRVGQRRFLLFLKRERDGRFSSITGQTDPAMGVKDLGLHP